MSDLELHSYAMIVYWCWGAFTIAALLFVTAPYGRHQRKGWGPVIPARAGWVLMELPAVVFFIGFFATGAAPWTAAPIVLLGFWQLHYIRRTFIYPFQIRATGKTMPLMIVVPAFVYNILNAYVNARWIGGLGTYDTSWLTEPRFIIGALIFLGGMAINIHSDAILRRLRAPGETGYKVPKGGFYRWVSSPNYMGEVLEWAGWAVMTWSLPGLAFFLYTVANLAPRAMSNHRWYQEKFPEYPAERKAMIPGIW